MGAVDEHDEDEYREPADYGRRGPMITVSVYRDRGCTDLSVVVRLIPGADTLTVDAPCTIRFNEDGR